MSLVAPVEPVAAVELGRVHLVGAGGAGMSGIARILLARGIPVSGSDAQNSPVLDELVELGATVYVGHAAEHVGEASTVVVSSAIRDTNPELVAAQQRGLRVLPRAAALAAVMAGRLGVAVAGTHGKTTTTSMLTVALSYCGVDPSYAIGGQLTSTGLGAHDGRGDIFVAEADESDGSFLMLAPYVAVITNVEADHLDNYGDEEAVRDAFTAFVSRVDSGGFVVACADDPGAWALAEQARNRGLDVRTYGESPAADMRITDVVTHGLEISGELSWHGERVAALALGVPGRHNLLDAAATVTVAQGLGFPVGTVCAGLAGFRGARRRFELKGEVGGVRVIDSYAHHPTEIAADLRAARDAVAGGRVLTAFQPHLYSRTRLFATELGQALGLADRAVVMDVYAAREDPEPGVSGQLVAAAVPLPAGYVRYEPEPETVVELLASVAGPGDIVLTVGAGDVTHLGPRLVAALGDHARVPAE